MAKNKSGLGKFIAFATIAGAVAAGISYITKYKSFNKELEEDFHDFEDNDASADDEPVDSTMSRTYVSLNSGKAEEAADAIKEAAAEVKEDVADAASEAADQIADIAEDVSDAAKDVVKDVADTATTIIEDAVE